MAARLGIAAAAVNWSQRYRATDNVLPGKIGGNRHRVLEPYRTFIVKRIRQNPNPNLTLHRLKDELAVHGMTPSDGSFGGRAQWRNR